MHMLFLWFGFAGAWLLFAGPIYQAILELKDEDIAVDRVRAAGANMERSPKVSTWWWLLPPVKFYKEFKRGNQNRNAIMKLLSDDDVASMINFNAKATAWLYVAVGGLCIAAKETYELLEHYEMGLPLIGLAIIIMFGLCIGNVVYRLKRADRFKTRLR